jgi:hypothetical protein
MFVRRINVLIVLTLIFSMIIACTPQPGETPADMLELQVLVLDDQIVPKEYSVKPGQKMRLFITNGSERPHSLTLKEHGLDQKVEANGNEVVDFQAPNAKGVYNITSVVDGKTEPGLEMRLLVEDPMERAKEQNRKDIEVYENK